MNRNKTFSISGINIVTHPHSPADYVHLFKTAFRERTSVLVRGHQRLMIGSLLNIKSNDPTKGLRGSFYRFVQIDKTAPWFNVKRHDKASEEELSLIKIPDALRPNTETFEFIFYPNGHTLYFNRLSGTTVNKRRPIIGPMQVAKLLEALFRVPSILDKYGEVEITVLPDKEQLDRILAIPKLRKLIIDVTKPNADELSKAQIKVFGRLERMNARRIREEITSERFESVTLDEDSKLLAKVAATNGKVEGHGYNSQDQLVTLSTVAMPWLENVSYNPEVDTEFSALAAATENLPGHRE